MSGHCLCGEVKIDVAAHRGSHLWFRADDGDHHYALMPGLFDAARDIPLGSEIYTDRALPGLALSGDHRRATRAEYEARNAHLEGDQP